MVTGQGKRWHWIIYVSAWNQTFFGVIFKSILYACPLIHIINHSFKWTSYFFGDFQLPSCMKLVTRLAVWYVLVNNWTRVWKQQKKLNEAWIQYKISLFTDLKMENTGRTHLHTLNDSQSPTINVTLIKLVATYSCTIQGNYELQGIPFMLTNLNSGSKWIKYLKFMLINCS